MNLFNYNEEDIKPLLRIADFGLVKYQKKEPPEDLTKLFKDDSIHKKHFPSNDDAMAILEKKVNRGITNERQAILETIRTTINEERATSKEKKKYPPITGRALAIKLSHVETKILYWMDSEAKDYKNRGKGAYGQVIFGMVKVKK